MEEKPKLKRDVQKINEVSEIRNIYEYKINKKLEKEFKIMNNSSELNNDRTNKNKINYQDSLESELDNYKRYKSIDYGVRSNNSEMSRERTKKSYLNSMI